MDFIKRLINRKLITYLKGIFRTVVKELGGDIAWFNDVRNALDNVYEQIEESAGAVAHLQMKYKQ